MTENHFNTTPGKVDSTKPLTEYTLEELKGEINIYENEIKVRQIMGTSDDWYSNFLLSWLEKLRQQLQNKRGPEKQKLEDAQTWTQGELF